MPATAQKYGLPTGLPRKTESICPECGKAMPTKKFCSNCGAEIGANAKFCPECGEKL